MMKERIKANLTRLLADYGMLIVLLLLCVYYTLVTWTVQTPEGARAAEQVAGKIDAGQRVLVVVGAGDADRAFVAAMEAHAKSTGFVIVESVRGSPADAMAAMRREAASGVKLDAIVVTTATRAWGVFDNLAERVPALAQTPFLLPEEESGSVFLSRANLLNVVNQIVVIAVIAIGMTFVIITAGIDLSVGSLVALSGIVGTIIIRDAMGGKDAGTASMVLALASAVAVCALVGLFNGFFVAALSIPPFIVTLATMLIAEGLSLKFSGSQSISDVPPAFSELGRGATLGIPNAVALLVVLYAAAHVVMSRMTLGRCVYAIGGNAEAARLSGIPVRRVLLLVYTLSGAMAGLAGIVLASQLGAAAPTYGEPYELIAIAAVVVGGTSLMGGEGKVLGTLIGAFIIAIIRNGMNLTNVDPNNQKIVLGAVILAAVVLDTAKKRGWLRLLWKRRK